MPAVRSLRLLLAAAMIVAAGGPAMLCADDGAGFTYQGRLMRHGEPVGGVVDFGFRLYDQPIDGSALDTLFVSGFSIAEEGLFTIRFDFGTSAHAENERWLEIEVNGYVLTPRELITPVPDAMVATAADCELVFRQVPGIEPDEFGSNVVVHVLSSAQTGFAATLFDAYSKPPRVDGRAHRGNGMPTVGAMGDSLTDEYAEASYDYARNWVQQVVMFRGLDFGPTAAEAGQPGGTWGEPRRTQYRHNWARSGADSATLLSQGQHTGLAAQIGPLAIEHTSLAIGANDFSPGGSAYFSIYWGLWSQAQRQAYVNSVAANIAAAMDAVLAEGVNFILLNVPDYGVTPVARQFYPNASRRENVTAVINKLNAILHNLAEEREIVLIDTAAMATAIFGTNFDLNEILLLGNVPIYLWESDTSGNTNPQAAFVDDGVHPHTTLQGIFANVFLEAMNTGYGANVPLLSEQEILSHAGLSYGGADTLANEIGPFADYVFDFTPAPALPGDIDGDGIVDETDRTLFIGVLLGTNTNPDHVERSDMNGDGLANADDIPPFVAALLDL
jgi:hypothetical protein